MINTCYATDKLFGINAAILYNHAASSVYCTFRLSNLLGLEFTNCNL